jgi:hypothetical protein
MVWWCILWVVLVALAVGFMVGACIVSAGHGQRKEDKP